MTIEATTSPKIDRGVWFDDLVATIRAHELQIETDTASEPVKDIYEKLMSGNTDDMIKGQKLVAQKYFVSKIIIDYLKLAAKTSLNKLAFDYNDSEVLVWAEIPDDRYDLEKVLILAEAKINAKYHDCGFDMSTTIVEESDKLPIPSHYKVVAERE